MKTKTLPIRLWLGMALLLVVGMPVVAMSVVAALSVRETTQVAHGIDTVRESVTGNVARWSDPMWQQQIRAQLVAADTDVVLVNSAGQEVYRSTPDPLASPTEIPGVVQYVSTGGQPPPSPPDQPPSLLGKGVVFSGTLIRPFTTLTVMDGGQRVGTAQFFVGQGEPFATQLLPLNPFRKWLLALAGPSGLHMALAGLIALVMTAALVAWFLGRTLLRPLAATSRAAREIAAGNLDFTLPASHVLEVAEVGAAFRTMGDALRASLSEQEAVEQERRFFIAAIVHDLRTPLFSLRGYLDGLAAGLAETPAKAATYLIICRKKAAMLDRLVSDLFAYARMEYLDQTLQSARMDAASLLRAAVEGVRPQAAEKEITLSCDGPPTPCVIEADGDLMTRAVENLLDNALRYTPTGGTVRVSWREAPSGVTFTVADSGPGIPPDDLPQLFAPLFRGETSRNRMTGGVGLGLTIALRILRAHGGDLTAANAPEGGACFVASVPLHQAGTADGRCATSMPSHATLMHSA